MNVYDFDQTIFYPDSSYCFCMHCLKKYPGRLAPLLPLLAVKAAAAGLGLTTTQKLKEGAFSFLPRIPDIDAEIEEFWRLHWKNVQGWYLEQKKPDDVIISASPDFLVRPAAEKLGARLIATPMNIKNGRIEGANCHDSEKVRRFTAEYPGEQVDEFYSDSLHDRPMAALANRAFIVKKGVLSPWPDK